MSFARWMFVTQSCRNWREKNIYTNRREKKYVYKSVRNYVYFLYICRVILYGE